MHLAVHKLKKKVSCLVHFFVFLLMGNCCKMKFWLPLKLEKLPSHFVALS